MDIFWLQNISRTPSILILKQLFKQLRELQRFSTGRLEINSQFLNIEILIDVFFFLFLFDYSTRIKKGYPFEVEAVCSILPQMLTDLFPPSEILTKVIGEFLSPQQPHPKQLAAVVFQVILMLISLFLIISKLFKLFTILKLIKKHLILIVDIFTYSL